MFKVNMFYQNTSSDTTTSVCNHLKHSLIIENIKGKTYKMKNLKDALSGLGQRFATENPLKVVKMLSSKS